MLSSTTFMLTSFPKWHSVACSEGNQYHPGATIGTEGLRSFNLMSNMDFLAIPLGKYIQNNLDFAKGLKKLPLIFGTNYFLKKEGKYLNGMLDKAVWVKWMELRVGGDVEPIVAPTGLIPRHEDLQRLFKQCLDEAGHRKPLLNKKSNSSARW